MKAKDLDIFLGTDQPETCRHCGVRTEFFEMKDNRQLHHCTSCDEVYIVENEDAS